MSFVKPTVQALMDVLATEGETFDYKGVIFLCSQWGIKPHLEYPPDGGRPYYNWEETIRQLARYVRAQSGAQS